MQFLLHLFIPFKCLLGYLSCSFVTLALTRYPLRFCCRLYAIMGGLLNTSPKYESLDFIDLQCLACMDPKEMSLWSKVAANTGLSLFLGLDFFLKAFSCGISLGLFIAESMIYSG